MEENINNEQRGLKESKGIHSTNISDNERGIASVAPDNNIENQIESDEKNRIKDDVQEEELFFDEWCKELGITRHEFENIIKKGENGDTEVIESYLENYWTRRKNSSSFANATMHRAINRFYYMLAEKRFITKLDYLTERLGLKTKWKIKPSEAKTKKAELWLLIASLYVEVDRRKGYDNTRAKEEEEALKSSYPPDIWLIPIKGKKREDFKVTTRKEIIKRAKQAGKKLSKEEIEREFIKLNENVEYHRFIYDLKDYWFHFVKSFQECSHYTTINRYPKLVSPDEWVSLASYVKDRTPRRLFEDILKERGLWKQFNSTYILLETLKNMPFYCRIGVDPRFEGPKMEDAPSRILSVKPLCGYDKSQAHRKKNE